MVTEENFSDRVLNFNTRPALSDVTNRPSKRPFSSISADSPRKTTSDGDSHFAKKKFHHQLGANFTTHFNHDEPLQFQEKGNKPKPSLSLPFCGAISDASLRSFSSQRSDPPTNNLPEEQTFFTGAGVTSLGFGEDVPDRNPSGVPEGIPITEGLSNRIIQNAHTEVSVDKLASSKSIVVEPPMISASHDFGFLGRCSALKGASGANSSVDSVDLLKQCTCSFCSKAAYIWSDLHYQDVKGRLGALKKSQKEASSTLQRFSDLKEKLVHDPQSTTESSKLELILMEQWKSLFVHMGNTFAQETKQLESKFEELRDLRESCRSSLDSTDNSNSDNH